jgi:hypothetical protein
MSRTHGHTHHLGLPVLHLHSPHFGWHTIEHPLRATLVVASALVGVALLGLTARGLPALPPLSTLLPASALVETGAVPWTTRELPREWRYEIEAVDVESMYGARAQAPSVAPMYRTRY